MKTTTVETSQLSGAALDWAVAKAVGHDALFGQWGTLHYGAIIRQPVDLFPDQTVPFRPSADWSQGGPLIQEEQVEICWQGIDGKAVFWIAHHEDAHYNQSGDTPLIAACRAIVAAELGDDVEVPAELVEAEGL